MNVNEALQDKVLVHSIYLLRVQAGQRKAVLRQLASLERDLIRQLETANLTTFRKDRVDRLLKLVQTTIRASYKGIRDSQVTELLDLADLEAQWTARSLNSAISVALPVTIMVSDIAFSPQFLKSVVSNVMVDNELLSSFWAKQAGALRGRIADAIRLGLLKLETTPDIVRKIRGSRSLNYSDGIFAVSRRNAESLVRTSIAAVSSDMRMHMYAANKELLAYVEQLSTLDARTSLTCIAYDRKRWSIDQHVPLGHSLPFNRGVPRHWQCRSVLTPRTKSWDMLGGLPLKQLDHKTLDAHFRDELRTMGWDEARVQRAGLNIRSSMDGDVPSTVAYPQWFSHQSKAFQLETLGRGRFDLYQSGQLTHLEQLVDFSGSPLTVRQLRERYSL